MQKFVSYSAQLRQHKLRFTALQFDGFKVLPKPSLSGNTRRDGIKIQQRLGTEEQSLQHLRIQAQSLQLIATF